MPGKEKKIEAYCILCDNKIEKIIVDDIERSVCTVCRLVTSGYTEEEKDIVRKLKYLFMKKDWYQIEGVLNVFRSEEKCKEKKRERKA